MTVTYLILLILILAALPKKSIGYNFGLVNFNVDAITSVQKFLVEQNGTISLQCKNDMLQYVNDLMKGKLWALRMLDASGKFPSSILNGNLIDFGSFDECLDIEEDIQTEQKIRGKYCIATTPINVTLAGVVLQSLKPGTAQMIELGGALSSINKSCIQRAVCTPHACSATEIQAIAQTLGWGSLFYEELCQTKETQPKLDAGAKATISVFFVIVSIVILSTVYEIFLHYKQKPLFHPSLTAFSLMTNGKLLFSTSNCTKRFLCLDGIRAITTIWIVFTHTVSIRQHYPSINFSSTREWLNDEANMYLMGATVCVDTFFLLTGLLIVYSYMNMIVIRKAKFNIFMYYIHRYLRLTPVLAMIMIIHITLLKHMGSGPLWPTAFQQELIGSCEKYWWKTLLYIQNYGSQDYICVPQSWYLSIDMQLFILSPILLIPLKKWQNLTLTAVGLLTACSIVNCFIVGWYFKLNMNIFGNRELEKLRNFATYYYYATQSRAAPWLIGIILGYVIFKVQQRKKNIVINQVLVLVLWIISLTVMCVCVFAGHDLILGEYDQVRNSLHIAFVRPSWAIAVGWIIFACSFGYGGPINKFLSLPIFQILSKLTFTMYLAHYTIIHISMGHRRTPSSGYQMLWVHEFWSDFSFTCIVSIIVALTIELPIAAIEKILFHQQRPTEKQLDKGAVK